MVGHLFSTAPPGDWSVTSVKHTALRWNLSVSDNPCLSFLDIMRKDYCDELSWR